jgi:hypothetical protein
MTNRQIAAILFAVAALAGCAPAAGSGTTDSGPAARQGPANAAFQAPESSGAGAKNLSAGPSNSLATTIIVGTPGSDIERSVTAAYTVPSGSFLSSFAGVIARAVGFGGYVVTSSTQPDRTGRIVSGAVTLKVPATKIAELLNGMPASFVASSINFSSIDHTAQFIDVNARLASAHAHLAALDTLLARATSIADITNLEQQIEAVQTEIDTDQGELNVLTASVELATATIRMSERGVHVAPVVAANPVGGGISTGWTNAVRVTGAALEGVVSALPLLLLLAVALVVWRRVARAPGTKRTARTAE